MELTATHWLYSLMTLVVMVTMIFRRSVVLPTLLGTLLVGWVYKGSIVGGFTAVFNANLTAAKELFNIFLIITFMVALLQALKDLEADQKMIVPIRKVMINGHIAFFVLIIFMFVFSLFFWPTPAVPLVGALLVPAAIRAGLPAIGAAMAMVLAGQGMALSSDYVMQVAPGLSATAAGLETAVVADKALVLSIVTGCVAISLGYFMIRKNINKPESEEALNQLHTLEAVATTPVAQNQSGTDVNRSEKKDFSRWSTMFAIFVPLAMFAVMIYMYYSKTGGEQINRLEGGDGAAFIGGVAVTLMILASLAYGRLRAIDRIAEHITAGFLFSFRAMGQIIPIGGFFFLGSNDFSGAILSLGNAPAPGFLFDTVQVIQTMIPASDMLAAFGMLIIGMITGLGGSGFSGLPLTGGLSVPLAVGTGIDPATLAAIGQMGAIWTGGGTIIAWSSMVAIAGFTGVPALELARKNVIPVISGLIISTIIALIIW